MLELVGCKGKDLHRCRWPFLQGAEDQSITQLMGGEGFEPSHG